MSNTFVPLDALTAPQLRWLAKVIFVIHPWRARLDAVKSALRRARRLGRDEADALRGAFVGLVDADGVRVTGLAGLSRAASIQVCSSSPGVTDRLVRTVRADVAAARAGNVRALSFPARAVAVPEGEPRLTEEELERLTKRSRPQVDIFFGMLAEGTYTITCYDSSSVARVELQMRSIFEGEERAVAPAAKKKGGAPRATDRNADYRAGFDAALARASR